MEDVVTAFTNGTFEETLTATQLVLAIDSARRQIGGTSLAPDLAKAILPPPVD
jgi:hypothetical protein